MESLLLANMRTIDQAAWKVFRNFDGRVWLDDLKSAAAYGAVLAAKRIVNRSDAARLAKKSIYREAYHYATAEARQAIYGAGWPTVRREPLVSYSDTPEQSYEQPLPFDVIKFTQTSGCTARESAAIELSVVYELPSLAVASLLGVTRKTVYRDLRRGLAALRTAMEVAA